MAHLKKYKLSAVHNMVGHYAREAEARGYERENVDPARTPQNYAIGADSPEALAGMVREAVAGAVEAHEADTGKRIRKDANVLCDWVITLPGDCPPERAVDFFDAAIAFLRARYGSECVPGGFVHMDEATPHMHAPVIPVRDGRLRASQVIDRADLRTFHGDLGRAEDAALGMHVSVELDPADKGARQLSHLSQDEYRAAKDELRRADRDVAAARAEAQSWARLSRALGPGGEGADVPQEDGSVRHQQSVGQLLTQREVMRAEAEAQLELARAARQQAGRDRETAARELAEARDEAARARDDARQAREAAEAAQKAQRAAEGVRDGLQGDIAALEAQREGTKRLAAEEYQRHLQVKAANMSAEAAQTLSAEAAPEVTREGLEAVWRDFSRVVAGRALDWWHSAAGRARELWSSWRHGEWGGRTADRLGIDRRDAGDMADEALADAAVERGETVAATDLMAVRLAPHEGHRRGL